MVILDNIIFSLQKAGGISLYWSELLKRVADSKLESEQYGSSNNNIFCPQELLIQKESSIPACVLRYMDFRGAISSHDIFHSSYYRISSMKNTMNITSVHDFTYEHYVSGLKKKVHMHQKKRAISHSDAIICVSENTKNDLLKFHPEVDEKKISVIYNGVSDSFYPLNRDSIGSVDFLKKELDKPFFLFIGQRGGYKRFDLAIEALRYFKSFNLVVVGVPFNEDELKLIEDVSDRVIYLGYVEEHILNLLYNMAFCLLYPSEYEGFGIPVVEAMRAGCPFIASKGSSIDEVSASALTLMESVNLENLITIIERLEEIAFRRLVIDDGIRKASEFSWDKCCEQTIDIYKKLGAN